MIVDTYRDEDRAEVDALFRQVFGVAQADASARRWNWQYRENPNARTPQIWIARDNGKVIGQYATMPVRLHLDGREIDASWGMDVMIAPERQRTGLGEVLFRTWDEHTGASLGMGLSTASYRLFQKLHWPDVGPVPCLIKPLTAEAFTHQNWPAAINGLLRLVAQPVAAALRADRHVDPRVRPVRAFDARFTDLWERAASKFAFAVRRDAPYLQWKYLDVPHVHYDVIAMERNETVGGYAVFKHGVEPRGRVTTIVDLFADPDDAETANALLRSIERSAREAGSDKIRAFMMNAAFRGAMQRLRYFQVASTIQLVAKINAVPVGVEFYAKRDRWHVTFGDSDQDR